MMLSSRFVVNTARQAMLNGHKLKALGNQLAPCAASISKRHMSRIDDPNSEPTDIEAIAKERYDTRQGENVETKRARLLYQSRKRGMLENGVILASFANKFLQELNDEQLDEYDRLINLPTNDWDIYYWATKTKPTPPEFETAVMSKLREHLNSKVSNPASESVLGKTRPDDIILPVIKKNYDLNFDASQTSLIDFKQDLYDDRLKTYSGGASIELMTTWRKKMTVRRLKRVISSPTSIKKAYKNDEADVYTQKIDEKQVQREISSPKDLIDTPYERNMKHHNFLQHLLSSELTEDPLEYDDEAEAWAEMLWHRNYGSLNDKISPSTDSKCASCQSNLHCCDPGLNGYVPQEIFVSISANEKFKQSEKLCQRCKFSNTYNARLSHDVSVKQYEAMLQEMCDMPSSVICLLVDLTDMPGSIWEGFRNLVGRRHKLIVVGNKLDLLPYDGAKMIERVRYCLKTNLTRLMPGETDLKVHDVTVISARTGFGIDGLISRIIQFSEGIRDVFLVGCNNSGKSTLFSSLIQSDLCATRQGDLISRVSTYKCPITSVNRLRFPLEMVEGWEIVSKRRRAICAERNTAIREHSLGQLSQRRQSSMPHISTLIDRLEYTPLGDTTYLAATDGKSSSRDEKNFKAEPLPNFSEDHPLAKLKDREPLSATEDIFPENKFIHQTASCSHPDQMHDLLTLEERLEVFPSETIMPRKYSLRPFQTIFIAGLARLDLLTSQSNVIFTIFASKYLPIHVISTRKADQFYNTFLGTPYLGIPFGNDQRLAAWPELVSANEDFHIKAEACQAAACDIVLSSVAWALVNCGPDQECIVRAYTPEGRGIFRRDTPLLKYARAGTRALGKKIRDTPVFMNPNYVIESRSG